MCEVDSLQTTHANIHEKSQYGYVAKIYQSLKVYSTCLQAMKKVSQYSGTACLRVQEGFCIDKVKNFISRRKTKNFLEHLQSNDNLIIWFCCDFNHSCPRIEPSSTPGYRFLEVENFRYIANVDEPYGPESVIFLFFWNIVQEPMVGSVTVEILVLSCYWIDSITAKGLLFYSIFHTIVFLMDFDIGEPYE
jgi:hypothetical protein